MLSAVNRLSAIINVTKPNLNLFTVISTQCRNAHDYTGTVMPEIPEIGVEAVKQKHWLSYNDKIFPPQQPHEERRPAYVCHMRENIKYSPKKMWYIACMVRGLSVEEAIRQLDFVVKKGASAVKDTILEAQRMAVEEHNVEFKTNLWVAESFVGKGVVVKGLRRHARMRFGKVEYKHCHYFVSLEEGNPPAQYYPTPATDRQSLLDKYLTSMRNRRVINSL